MLQKFVALGLLLHALRVHVTEVDTRSLHCKDSRQDKTHPSHLLESDHTPHSSDPATTVTFSHLLTPLVTYPLRDYAKNTTSQTHSFFSRSYTLRRTYPHGQKKPSTWSPQSLLIPSTYAFRRLPLLSLPSPWQSRRHTANSPFGFTHPGWVMFWLPLPMPLDYQGSVHSTRRIGKRGAW
nr:hypothetical protein L203_03254 [Cryptococcus depauperatus CBS 7841]